MNKRFNGVETQEILDKKYRDEVKRRMDRGLDWIENGLNGKLLGKSWRMPLFINDCQFMITVEMASMGEYTAKKYKITKKVVDKAYTKAYTKTQH